MGKGHGAGPAPPHGRPRGGTTAQRLFGERQKKNSPARAVDDREDLRLTESDSGIDLSQGNVCPVCGAQNNGGQSHCWQCKSLLPQNHPRGHLTPSETDHSRRRESALLAAPAGGLFWCAIGLLVLSMLAAAARTVYVLRGPARAPVDLTDIFAHDLLLTKAVVGVALLLISPLLLHFVLKILTARLGHTGSQVALASLVPPATAFALVWLPLNAYPAVVLATVVFTWIALNQGLSMQPALTLKTCMLYLPLFLMAGAGLTWIAESIQTGAPLNPATEINAVRTALADPDRGEQDIPLDSPAQAPALMWESTGSIWLDRRANRAQLLLHASRPRERAVEIVDVETGKKLLSGQAGGESWHSPLFTPSLGTSYALQISGGLEPGDGVRVRGILPVRIRPRKQ